MATKHTYLVTLTRSRTSYESKEVRVTAASEGEAAKKALARSAAIEWQVDDELVGDIETDVQPDDD